MKNFRKKLIAVSVLSAFAFNVMSYLPIQFTTQNTVVSAEGLGGSIGGGSGGNIGGSYVTKGMLINKTSSCAGFRVYFAKRELAIGKDNESSILRIDNTSIQHLDDYRDNKSVYFVSGEYGENVKNGESPLYSYRAGGLVEKVPQEHIVSLGNNKGYDVTALFGDKLSDMKAPYFGYKTDDSAEVGFSAFADWANEIFVGKDGNEILDEELMDTFCSNFSSIIANGYSQDKASEYIKDLPKSSEEYIDGQFAVIIEPFFIVREAGGSGNDWKGKPKYAFSFNDFIYPQGKGSGECNEIRGDKTTSGYIPTMTSAYYCGNKNGWGLGDAVKNILLDFFGGYATKFDYKNASLNTIDTNFAGFGFYSVDEKLIGGGKASSSRNISLFADNVSTEGKANITSADNNVVFANNTATNLTGDGTGSWWKTSDTDTWGTMTEGVPKIKYFRNSESYIPSQDSFMTGSYNASKPESDEAGAHQRLSGRTDAEIKKYADDYILAEYSAGTITADITGTPIGGHGYNVSTSDEVTGGIYTDIDTSNFNIKAAEISINTDSPYVIGYNYTPQFYINENRDVVSKIAESVASGVSDGNNATITGIAVEKPAHALTDATAIDNAILNTQTASLNSSSLRLNKKADTIANAGNNKKATVGVSTSLYIKDKKVTSIEAEVSRDVSGKISINSGATETAEYSAYTSCHTVTSTVADSDTITYCIAYPNTSDNSELTDDVLNKICEAVFTFGEGEIETYNAPDGLARLQYKVKNIASNITVVPITASADIVGETTTSVSIGAFADGDNFVGYSVIKLTDSFVQPVQKVNMHLESHELNYVYPTLLGDSEGHLIRTADSFYDYYISKNKNYGGSIIDGEYVDLAQFEILEDKVTSNRFAPESVNPKYLNGESTLNHMISFNRADFGDKYTVSGITPMSEEMKKFVTEGLGLEISSQNRTSKSSVAENSVGLYTTTHDMFTWEVNKPFERIINLMGRTFTAYVSPFTDGSSMNNAGYDITGKIYRYEPSASFNNVGRNSSRLTDLHPATDNQYDYSSFSVEAYSDELKFTPEVPMTAYMYDASSMSIDKAPTPVFINVLSEYERAVQTSGMYNIGVSNGNVNGSFRSDTIATGSKADALSKSFYNLPVVYSGGNISLSANCDFNINVSGFILDMADGTSKIISADGSEVDYDSYIGDGTNLKAVWKNEGYSPKTKFEAWRDSVKNNLGLDVSLAVYGDADCNSFITRYSGYNTSYSEISGGDILSETAYAITFENGGIADDAAYHQLKIAIAQNRFNTSSPTPAQVEEAGKIFEKSGIMQSMLDSVEGRYNSVNKSNSSDERASTLYGSDTWYDESVRTFVIRYYECTPITFGSVVVNDKLEINAGPGSTSHNSGYIGHRAAWEVTAYLKDKISSLPDMAIYNRYDNLEDSRNTGGIIVSRAKVSGADFVIASATTADARN